MNHWLNAFREYFKPARTIYSDVLENRRFSPVYLCMLIFAALISLCGLLTNSAAVIIGAMLISPLMGPILACGLALSLADIRLGKKAGANLAFSVAESILIAAIATWLSPLKEITPEIVARTAPNLMDLFIAVFSGMAGTIALTSKGSGMMTIIPGVAIATAVMPPLATVGYGISTGQWDVASGALMLFFTNLMAIVISASAVFLLIGFRPRLELDSEEHHVLVRYRMVGALLILAVLSIPLFRTLMRAAHQASLKNEISAVLRNELQGVDLSELHFSDEPSQLSVSATVRTAKVVPLDSVHRLEQALGQIVHKTATIDLHQIQFADNAAKPAPPPHVTNDFVAGGVIHSDHPAEDTSVEASLHRAKDEVQSELLPLATGAGVQNLVVDSSSIKDDSKIEITFHGDEAGITDPGTWSVVGIALARDLKAPVVLHGTLSVAASAGAVIRFRPRSSRPTPDGVKLLGELSDRFAARPDIGLFAAVSPDAAHALLQQRLKTLKTALPSLATDPAPISDSSLDGDTIRIAIKQNVEWISPVAPPTPAPATTTPPEANSAAPAQPAATNGTPNKNTAKQK